MKNNIKDKKLKSSRLVNTIMDLTNNINIEKLTDDNIKELSYEFNTIMELISNIDIEKLTDDNIKDINDKLADLVIIVFPLTIYA